jgi:Domain of unknown function (DUF222)/HNH endonuclease
MGLEGAPGGELEFAGAVPAATVQRLACDGRIRRILLGPNSAVIDVGRAQRIPSPATRDALRARSGGCEWPRCDRTVAFTNAHHLVHWGHGGGTDLGNLVLLCYRHHWLIHEGGWQLARAERRLLIAIPPSRTHRSWIRGPIGIPSGRGERTTADSSGSRRQSECAVPEPTRSHRQTLISDSPGTSWDEVLGSDSLVTERCTESPFPGQGLLELEVSLSDG